MTLHEVATYQNEAAAAYRKAAEALAASDVPVATFFQRQAAFNARMATTSLHYKLNLPQPR